MNATLVAQIRERYLNIVDQIAQTKKHTKNQEVKVIVVSKSQPFEIVKSAIAAGVMRFGENYSEEAVNKMAVTTAENLEWHMIGHVQSRKANLVVDHFHMLHSLDSIKLANRLNTFCVQSNRNLPVLLEVNVSGETTKYGFPAWEETKWPELVVDFRNINNLSHLRIHGLMTMPPWFSDKEFSRPFFEKTRCLQEYLSNSIPNADWSELSMGTSNDFIIAVEEGATFVRIGEAILGKREVFKTVP